MRQAVHLLQLAARYGQANKEKPLVQIIIEATFGTRGPTFFVHLKIIPELSIPRGFEIVGLFPTGCFGI